MAARTTQIQNDAENKQLFMQVVDGSGNPVAGWGQIKLKLGKDPGSLGANPGHNMGLSIEFRETKGCDPATGDDRFCIMLRSAWYNAALTSNPDA